MRCTSFTIGAFTLLAGCRDAATAPTVEPLAARKSVAGYAAVEFPALPGGDVFGALVFAINARGQIAGASNVANSGSFHAARWVGRAPEDLGTLGGISSSATDINDLGDVVGQAVNSDGYAHAFLFTDKGGIEDLGTPNGLQSVANAINNRRVVVGSHETGPFTPGRAFRWTRAGGMQDLRTLPDGFSIEALNINNRGDIVGAADTPAGKRGVLWTNTGAIIALGTLPNSFFSSASAINERGEIVGSSTTSSDFSRAVLWTPNGQILNLGVLPGDQESWAYGINNTGAVVGISVGIFGFRGFVWTRDGGMRALPTLGTDETFAYDVNDAATAAGYSLGVRWHALEWVTAQLPIASLAAAATPAPAFVAGRAVRQSPPIKGALVSAALLLQGSNQRQLAPTRAP